MTMFQDLTQDPNSPVKGARSNLATHIADKAVLFRWGWSSGSSTKAVIPGCAIVREAIARCNLALERLGDRKGPRAEVARAFLTAENTRMIDALAAVESVATPGFPGGPTFEDLHGRYVAALLEIEAAKEVLNQSTRATVQEARAGLDHAEAGLRETVALVDSLALRMLWPAPTPAAAFDAAENATADLLRAAKGSAPIALEKARKRSRPCGGVFLTTRS